MPGNRLEYGPLARGGFLGLIALMPVTGASFPELLPYHFALILFLGLCLRPIIEKSGALDAWQQLQRAVSDRWNRRFNERRRQEIERRVRDEHYRKQRYRDPDLPERW